ncbi:DNA-deoxyinosine glycosylase [Acidovorax sp. NCPPB 3576]|uniref:DNA-deoxyinosine glycosylase n=1 Tax=Acidovorax sp. NCPPB 3576 TaxID=2940488 RepID=UPI00234B549B|nr:DNA-deoxyinosine glycosylase [Acidovorax sp. NCPPB 3576]WCM89438.1 DNA-deoxyinosine glycosylase [Acidovorax sp. NCPPB 3576]
MDSASDPPDPPHPAPPAPSGPVPAAAPRLVGLAPVVSPRTVVLLLGSFPGAASLREGQYYGHPQNHFWRILQALWPQPVLPGRDDYAGRCAWLLDRGLGLWDVYAACEREGSLDTDIRNAVVNDFRALRAQCPRLAAIAHNGGESFRHAKAVRTHLGLPPALLEGGVQSLRLPSTSPANASWSFDEKLNAWAAALGTYGLV